MLLLLFWEGRNTRTYWLLLFQVSSKSIEKERLVRCSPSNTFNIEQGDLVIFGLQGYFIKCFILSLRPIIYDEENKHYISELNIFCDGFNQTKFQMILSISWFLTMKKLRIIIVESLCCWKGQILLCNPIKGRRLRLLLLFLYIESKMYLHYFPRYSLYMLLDTKGILHRE